MAGPENEMPRLRSGAETKFGPGGSNLLAGETHGKVGIKTDEIYCKKIVLIFHCLLSHHLHSLPTVGNMKRRRVPGA